MKAMLSFILLIIGVFAVAMIIIADIEIVNSTDIYVFDDLSTIPHYRVALI